MISTTHEKNRFAIYRDSIITLIYIYYMNHTRSVFMSEMRFQVLYQYNISLKYCHLVGVFSKLFTFLHFYFKMV